MSLPAQLTKRIAVALVLLLAFAQLSYAAEQKLGFAVSMEGEGFFFNPLVKTLFVSEVIKGSLAEAAGLRTGDQIIQIEGQNVAGRRARSFSPT